MVWMYQPGKPKSVIRTAAVRHPYRRVTVATVLQFDFRLSFCRNQTNNMRIIHLYSIDGLKGQKYIAQGNALGLGRISFRPVRAKALLFFLLPFQGVCLASFSPKAMPWAEVSLSLWDVSTRGG